MIRGGIVQRRTGHERSQANILLKLMPNTSRKYWNEWVELWVKHQGNNFRYLYKSWLSVIVGWKAIYSTSDKGFYSWEHTLKVCCFLSTTLNFKLNSGSTSITYILGLSRPSVFYFARQIISSTLTIEPSYSLHTSSHFVGRFCFVVVRIKESKVWV